MLRQERINDLEETLRVLFDDLQARTWVQLPGIIQSFNPDEMTAVVQLAIKPRRRLKDGTIVEETITLLLDCPVLFPGGGGFTLTFPIKADDECLVFFADRCIDAWWQSGGVQSQIEVRLHDLSDGFVFVGPRSKPRVLSSISTDNAQLRSDDGAVFLEITPDQKIKITAPGGVEITGDLRVSGEVTAMGTHTVSAHKHGGVTSGGAQTATPTG